MIVIVRRWYDARSARERRLILAMAVIAVPLLIYLLLVAPLTSAYRESLQEHLAAVDRNGRVKALVEPSATGRSARRSVVSDLPLWLGDHARQAGITATAQGSTSRATVAIDSAAPAALFGWIASLEAAGYVIEDVRITPIPDGGVSAGLTVGTAGDRP